MVSTYCSALLLLLATFCSSGTAIDGLHAKSVPPQPHPGQIVIGDPTKPVYRVLAIDSLRQYEKQQGSKPNHRVVVVLNATEQVVAGLATRLDYLAEPEHPTYPQGLLYCHSEVWQKPERNTRQVKADCVELKPEHAN